MKFVGSECIIAQSEQPGPGELFRAIEAVHTYMPSQVKQPVTFKVGWKRVSRWNWMSTSWDWTTEATLGEQGPGTAAPVSGRLWSSKCVCVAMWIHTYYAGVASLLLLRHLARTPTFYSIIEEIKGVSLEAGALRNTIFWMPCKRSHGS